MSGKETGQDLISAHSRGEIDAWLAKYPADRKRSALLPALSIVQEQNGGWLSTELMDAVAEYLDLPPIAVYEVATFYSMFELEPVGRHMVSVCNNISCMLCGADDILQHIERKYGVTMGGTTADGRFTLKREEECLAACCGAPMMAVDGHYHENLTPEKVDAVLGALK
ncbi:MAG: NADH-quinone oxidoreductase subunit NuoE [Gammaproteobacteria bacterium]|nr:NADH-quinone oxidoreductase subunit NuoE [Gammaproteobacteria bacterium]